MSAGAIEREGRPDIHAARRLFAPDGATVGGGSLRDTNDLLELSSPVVEPPRVVSAEVIEGQSVRAHRLDGPLDVGFVAFLDGIQQSRVVHYTGSAPIVHGTVGAIVRRRVDRRLGTWERPIVEHRLYMPRALAGDAWERAEAAGWLLGDTTADHPIAGTDTHPFELLTLSVRAVQHRRDAVERELAESWCRREREPLFLDGSLSRSEVVARAPHVVGVVKSHRSLYAEGDAMRIVLALSSGERSSVVRVMSSRRPPVASWYLRLHARTSTDPMFGLIRIEMAEIDGESVSAMTERADRISRWVLAEAAPLSLPDWRWDRMVYGVRDCEEVLRALL